MVEMSIFLDRNGVEKSLIRTLALVWLCALEGQVHLNVKVTYWRTCPEIVHHYPSKHMTCFKGGGAAVGDSHHMWDEV